MKPSNLALTATAIIRARGKMYEYKVPSEHHNKLPEGLVLEELFPLAIGTLGDFAAETARKYLDIAPGTVTTQEELKFAATVLYAYVDSRLNDQLSFDLLLLGACAFYLCGMPGNAIVLSRRMQEFDEQGNEELVSLIRWALGTPWYNEAPIASETHAAQISGALKRHFKIGTSVANAILDIGALRRAAYQEGSARELLLADLYGAIVLSRIERSTWSLLPQYSQLSIDAWRPYLEREAALKELWPSQRLLGDAGIYSGASAVVQMPTSAGKTKATELVIRAAFLSGRASLAVVVAPFRALCQEITNALRNAFIDDDVQINQLSDAMQPDYLSEIIDLLGVTVVAQPHVVVLTPEKLLYVLRQRPDLVERIGLVIYDEGHQFDTGQRGVTYELLLTSIKRLLSTNAQTVLISAVILNAEALAAWLLNDAEKTVSDSATQAQRVIAFASWSDQLGQLSFHDKPGSDQSFYVPRVLVEEQLALKGRERKKQTFPVRTESGSIALFLGLKLVSNGGVAIFCGMKSSVTKILHNAADIFSRNTSLSAPSAVCNQEELTKLCYLYEQNFGAESDFTTAAKLGVFAHHGDTPHGLRLAIEHAMRERLIHFVVCTSTIAQGVNLPIRYLLVTGTHQGQGSIKVRDFHNLMGRAGRAGIHGEGTVIFSDPSLFDNREVWGQGWRWNEVQNLLSPGSTEPTGSSLLQLLLPLQNDKATNNIDVTSLVLIQGLLKQRSEIFVWANQLSDDLIKDGFSSKSILWQLEEKCSVLDAIESFLMSYREDKSSDIFFETALALARETFAYALANEDQKQQLEEVFREIAQNIEQKIPDVDEQARYGRTLLGLNLSLEIDKWVTENMAGVHAVTSEADLLDVLWPMLQNLTSEKLIRDVEPANAVNELAKEWISGKPFHSLFATLNNLEATYPYGTKRRPFTEAMVIGLCEQGFGFELTLLLAAVTEALSVQFAEDEEEKDRLVDLMNLLQKQLKYGLPTQSTIAFYEIGFAERVVAQAVDAAIGIQATSNTIARTLLKHSTAEVAPVMALFPAYFQSIFSGLTTT
jgi:POLQ-like helicase